MIIVVKGQKHILNPSSIVSLHLSKGKVTAFVEGDNDGDTIKVSDLKIREPWTVVIKTIKDTYYNNFSNFDDALEELINITCVLYNLTDAPKLRKDLRKHYEQEN